MEALQRLHNRGSVSTGYDIDNSVKLEPDNSESFNKTFGSAGNRKTWSYSCWIKKTELFSSNGGALISAYPDVNNRLKIAFSQYKIQVFGKVSGSTTVNVRTNRLYRDTSAFYHILVVFDTTQGTAANRVKIYTNGVLEDSFDQTTYPSQNNDEEIGNSSAHYIGQRGDGSSDFYAGYITEINYVNGQALAPTDFGEFDSDTGIWIPKAYSGSYGTNGFYLDFADASDLGDDESGNGNDFTEVNITAADQATDTPTNNFTTFNVLRRYNQDWVSFKEGATNVVTGSGNNWTTIFNTMAVNKGKWYFEGELYSNEITQMFGQQPQPFTEQNVNTDWYLGAAADKTKGAAYYGSGDDVYYEGGYVNSSASTGGDIISVAMDCDNNKVHFAVNGSWTNSSDPANNTNGFAMLDDYQYFATALFPGSATWKYNFGGYTTISISSAASDADGYGTFEYAPPSGYYALCTKNLEEYG